MKNAIPVLSVLGACERQNPSLPTYPAQMAIMYTAVMRWKRKESLTRMVENTATSAVGGWWRECAELWEEALEDSGEFQEWFGGTGRQNAQDAGGKVLQVAMRVAEEAAWNRLRGVCEGKVAYHPALVEFLVDSLDKSTERLWEEAVEAVRDSARKTGFSRDGVYYPSSAKYLRSIGPEEARSLCEPWCHVEYDENGEEFTVYWGETPYEREERAVFGGTREELREQLNEFFS